MFADLLISDICSVQDLARRCEVFCRRLAPHDLRGVPLYIVPSDQLGPELVEAAGDLGGYAGLETDLVARPYLRRWRGRGPAMVVSTSYCDQAQWNERCGRGRHAETIWWNPWHRVFFAIVLHELAHILERSRLYWPGSTPDDVPEATRAAVQSLKREESTRGDGPTAAVPWQDHGPPFIRLCLHLWHRAERLLAFHAEPLCAGVYYGLSSVTAYMEALGDEPRRMIEAPLREIKRSPWPPAFEEQWRRDLLQPHCAQVVT